MSKVKRWMTSLVVAAIAMFAVIQGVALADRLSATSNPILVLGIGLVISMLLLGGGAVLFYLMSRRSLRKFAELRADSGNAAWLVQRVPEFTRQMRELAAPVNDRVAMLFAVVFGDSTLRILNLPTARLLAEVEFASISNIEIGRTHYFGGASDCLVLTVLRSEMELTLSLVLCRDAPYRLLVQSADQLRASRKFLRTRIGRV